MRTYASLSVIFLLAVTANGQEAVPPTSASGATPVRDAANFRPRANVERLVQGKRTGGSKGDRQLFWQEK
jgi:hypothetical protein